MLRDRQPHQKLRVVPRAKTNLDLALTFFITAKEGERCTTRTIETYRWSLERFITWLREQGVDQVEDLTTNHVRLFLAELAKQDYAASYIHIYARTIKTWLRFMYREELVPVDIMAKVAMPRLDKTILPAFTPDDVRRLIAACDNLRDTAVVYCLLDSGCRAAELCKLTVGDVNTKTGNVMIRQGKGRKDRVAFLGAKARKVLMKYLMTRPGATEDEALFPSSKTGGALTPDGLLLLLRRLGKKAEVAHCHPHTFRRSFALWSLRAGMSVYALQQIMGHSDLSVLRKYLALVEQDLHEAHRKYGAVDSTL